MEENTFWFGLWSVLIIAITAMVGMGINHYTQQDKLVAQMVTDGMDPVAVSCVMHDSMGNNPSCIILATKDRE